MFEELAALAGAGATTLVGLMASDGWERFKDGRLGRFLLRRSAGGVTDDELTASGEQFERARAAGDAGAQARLVAQWQERLAAIFREDPGAAEELAAIFIELAPQASGGFVSLVTGGVTYGPAFQGSHIHGGITFHMHADTSATPARGVTPDQVPVPVRYSNQERKLAELGEMFGAWRHGERSVAVGALTGPPGVGTTALACRAAHVNRHLFPDGRLYVDFAALREETGSPGAAVSEALAMCLRSLNGRAMDDSWMPRTLAERANWFRSRSADLRILIVLDDVTAPAQVRALLPKGPGSAVLATGRGGLGELVADGARLIQVRPLDEEGGLTFLRDHCGADAVAAEPAAAARLVKLCDGLPVALKVAAHMVTDDGLTMAQLVAELSDETHRLPGLTFDGEESAVSVAFDSAYRMLSPDAARAYRVAGQLPSATFDAGVLAVAAETDTRTAMSLLRVLARACLVDAVGDGRYRMHDLVRLHARERAAAQEPEGTQAALIARVCTHYLVLTAFADRKLRRDRLRIADLSAFLQDAVDPFSAQGGPPPTAWLNAERHAIVEVLRAAVREGLFVLAWQLAEAFSVLFLYDRADRATWKAALELGADAAAEAAAAATSAGEIADATAAEARLRALLSRPLLELGANDQAKEQLDKAVTLADTSGHLVLRASVREFLGRYLDLFAPAEAVAAYRTSRELNEQAGESRGAAIATFFLGCALNARGDHAEAMAELLRARDELLNRPEKDDRMAARVSAEIGSVHHKLGNTDAAIQKLSDAARVLRDQSATYLEAQTLVRLIDIIDATGDRGELLRESLARVAELHEAVGSPMADSFRQRLAQLSDADS